ncbi:senecionine N-oxygenase-like [Contarinia nasturtii]|uniref:senecionine N-oxygenase-like n=1 Tax=Contarinia nasturtii TaxID=265458 RepID=UPI0012D4B81E|nr:senecionine N-oxygenase-like [Contarinia nasturtii]
MFPTHDVVWQYLDSYADEFGLKDHIKYHHLVVHVQSIDGDKWQIFVNDMQTNYTIMDTFDAVFVCTGFCSSPLYPNIPGEFKGKILMHSHDYRTPDKFEGEKVLVIGGGTSGTDIVHQIRGIAKRVTHSYHIPSEKMSLAQKALDKARGIFSRGDNGITHKGDVKRFTKNGAEFSDGTKKNFTVVIFATGYKYSYPFLDENVGICAHDFYVEPLFKQILNIEHNTMAFIGLPITVAHNPMYDLQARFALKFISGEKQFPSQTKMRQDLQKQINANAEFHLKKPYMLGLDYKRYFRELAKTANIENVPNIRSG